MPIGIATVGLPRRDGRTRCPPTCPPPAAAICISVDGAPAVGRGDRHDGRRPRPSGRWPSRCAAPTPAGSPSVPATTPSARRSARWPRTTSTSSSSTRPRAAGPCRSPRPPRWQPPTVAHSPAVVVDSQTATTIHLTVTGIDTAPGLHPLRPRAGRVDRQGMDGDRRRRARARHARPDRRLRQRLAYRSGHDGPLRPRRHAERHLDLDTPGDGRLGCAGVHRGHHRLPGAGPVADTPPAQGRPRREAGASDDPSIRTVDHPVDGPGVDQAVVLDRRPKVQLPFGSEGPRASVGDRRCWPRSWPGAVAAAIATPAAGLAVGAATLLVLFVPRLRFVLAIAAVTCVAAAGDLRGRPPGPAPGARQRCVAPVVRRGQHSGRGPAWCSWGPTVRWTASCGPGNGVSTGRTRVAGTAGEPETRRSRSTSSTDRQPPAPTDAGNVRLVVPAGGCQRKTVTSGPLETS